jgi:hypothetical protein
MKKRKQLIDNILPINKYGCHFRLVDVEDAEFILLLRNNKKLSKHLSPTSTDIEVQKSWIKNYKIREKNGKEFYFICLSPDKKFKLGLNRIYNFNREKFEIGSWLFSKQSEAGNSIICDLFSRTLAFEVLNFNICVFEVRKENKSVVNYHRRFSPKIVNEDDLNYYFELDFPNFEKQRNKLLNILYNDK